LVEVFDEPALLLAELVSLGDNFIGLPVDKKRRRPAGLTHKQIHEARAVRDFLSAIAF